MNGSHSSNPIETRSDSVSERSTTASSQELQDVSEAQISTRNVTVASRREITSNRSHEGVDPSVLASLEPTETDGVHKYELLVDSVLSSSSSSAGYIKVLEAPIGTVEVVFTGSTVTRHLAFAPADETFTKGLKLVGIAPLANGLPSDLEKDGLLRTGMVVGRINGEVVTDLEFEPGSCITLSFGVPTSSESPDIPRLITNNRSAVGLTMLEEEEENIRSGVHVTPGAEPSKWRKHLRRASSNSPISRAASRMSAGVSYIRKRATTSSPRSSHGPSNFVYSSPEVSNENDSGLCLCSNPEHELLSPTSMMCCSIQQRMAGASTSLSNIALTQFLYGFDNSSTSSECDGNTVHSTSRIISSNSTDEEFSSWKMEQLLWTDWVVPVIVKRHGAVHAVVLNRLSLYILEMKMKESDNKEVIDCTFPTQHFSLDKITSVRIILRLEPSEIVKIVIPYYLNVLEDRSEVAERGTDLYFDTKSGTFAWFKLRTNQHRSELLDCIDEWYSVFMGESDELLVDHCSYDTVFSYITETSCDCFVSNPSSEV